MPYDSITLGVPFTIDVYAYDNYGNVDENFNGQVPYYLLTSGTSQSAFLANGSVTLTNGHGTLEVTYSYPPPSNFYGRTGYFIQIASGNYAVTSGYIIPIQPQPTPTPTSTPGPPGPAVELVLSIPATAAVEGLFTGTITAVDSTGRTATGYNGTVELSAYDSLSDAPVNFSLSEHQITLTQGVATFQTFWEQQTGNPIVLPQGTFGDYFDMVGEDYTNGIYGSSGYVTVGTALPPPSPPTPTPVPATPPTFLGQPQSAIVVIGMPATFAAAGVSAGSSPSFQWSRSVDGGATWTALIDQGVISGSSTAALSITAAPRTMTGNQFELTISNSLGSTTTAPATLTVDPLPLLGSSVVYDFTTLAGSPGQQGSADGKGAAARFWAPYGVAVDGSGVVYVADTGNNTIRKITPDGTVTTLAGSAGQAGYSDGQGGAARFRSPYGVAVDVSGNLFVTDSANYCVREVSASGNVTTAQGVAGVSAYRDGTSSIAIAPPEFLDPLGIAIGSSQPGPDVYVTDSDSVRHVSGVYVSSIAGQTSTAGYADGFYVAGTTQARFAQPEGVAAGGGIVYVADSGNRAIRKVQAASSGIPQTVTVLGGPSSGSPLTSPAGLALDAGGNLFITDAGLDEVLELSSGGGFFVIGGAAIGGHADGAASAASFNSPTGLAIDGSGNLYIADTANHTIRKGVPRVQYSFPTIPTPPVNQSVSAGSPATFFVVANGNGLSYQWTFNGKPIAGATGSSYTVASAAVASSGSYAVVVTNAGGSVTSPAAILTLLPPSGTLSASVSSENLTVATGSPVVLSVTAGADATGAKLSPRADSGFTYQWFLDSVPLSDGDGVTGSQSSTLYLAPDAVEPGDYTCLVANASGSVLSDAAAVSLAPQSGNGGFTNLSCRAQTTPGSGAVIVGFTLSGEGSSIPARLLARVSGPALTTFGVGGVLADPQIQVFQTSNGTTLLAGDMGWAGSPLVAGTAAQAGAFAWTSTTSADSALVRNFLPGSYTVNASSASGASGVVLAELYSAPVPGSDTSDTPGLTNISARANVGAGSNVLIAGFVISGSSARTVLIRASGPALAKFGLTGLLPDPSLHLFSQGAGGTATLLQSDSGWGGDPEIAQAAASSGAFSWGTSATPDSAIVVTLQPGAYTAQVSGASGDTGIALIEVYEVP